MGSRLPRAIGGAAAVLILLGAAPAAAKVFFADMQGRVVRWDQRVSSTILGCPGNPSCGSVVEGTTVYLRRGARRAAPREATGLRVLGRIDADGRITFRVPRTAIGRYHLVAAPHAGATQLLPASGTFRIRQR